jgi:tetratricopeptide (TPR) repeat protein
MKILPVFILLVVFGTVAFAGNCLENAKVIAPALPSTIRKSYEKTLLEIKADYEKSPTADTTIWLGRRTAYLGNYKEAIKIFTDGIEKFPKDARFYRHRGHRFITLRCFEDAVKDFQKAWDVIKRYKIADEIEPDGIPNSRNTPTSTLWTNIYYHQGLAYYLKGDIDKALTALLNCFNQAKNDDMRVAAAHWMYMSALRLSKEKDAKDFIVKEIKDDLDIIENHDYYKLIQLYRGKLKAEDLLKEISEKECCASLSNASLGYGLGNWFLYNGEKEEALKIFRQITSGNQWANFGFIAAEVELKRAETN